MRRKPVSDEPQPSVSMGVQAQVREILSTAHTAAAENERQAQAQADETVAQARAEADRVRADAEAAALAYLEDARRRVDAFAQGRVQRISELTDTLLSRAEAIDARLADVEGLQQEVSDLVEALRAAAGAAAAEGSRPAIRLPALEATPERDDRGASELVRAIARELPPRPKRRPDPRRSARPGGV